ncbi:hypothetical protein POX_a01487 [Penicillium oxalicum]|uniref:MARVEL domain-containing protein n=1 Tax=Penicillium oxalicum (strain 114-2 / CGMCC 5302) TaxID=933388 RepID=S8BEM5_PENO1|nr:hypothetical protein POX_a01487 [Penicillium oxalicum]EPS33517.1 hypothetical protein PDE_08479 [Penicillium oxalicum 114-2]KAI2794886.1 hypothetical protein POX_a01487 [Penicillium oxalicum]
MSSFHSHPLGIITLIAHCLQCASALIVLGITAWAVRGTKNLTVIYTLVISVLTPVFFAVATGLSCTGRRRTRPLPLFLADIVLSYLWLTAFIFLAQNFNAVNCRLSRWNGEIVCSRQYAAEAFSFIAFFASLMSLLLQYLYALYYNPDDYNFHPHTMEQTQARQNLQGNLENAGVM